MSRYLLVALPSNIVRSADETEAFARLKATIPADAGDVARFAIPEFKIGTLDALVQQADELAKLDGQIEAAVAKVADVLLVVCDGDSNKAAEHKMVNDKPIDQYLRFFTWTRNKYRTDRPISELVTMLQREVVSLDADLKAKFTQYQSSRSTLTALEKKSTGNLSTCSLHSIVTADDLVPADSEYLTTLLVAVPNPLTRDWLHKYETLAPYVVPRSSSQLAQDDEFTLFSVTLFKKHAPEFVHKARAEKFVPRDFSYAPDAAATAEREASNARTMERKLWNETLRLARTAYSDEVMAWIHIKALRVFVESVLRYGLPLEFVSGIVRTTNSKALAKAKKQLDSAFNYLGGNAFGRDKHGNITDDLPGDAATGDAADYTAYVYYEFTVA